MQINLTALMKGGSPTDIGVLFGWIQNLLV